MNSTTDRTAEGGVKIGSDVKNTASRAVKIRVLREVNRPMQFSAPAPGRPEVWWSEGIDRGLVREHWCSQGEVPFEESTAVLPAGLFPGSERKQVRTGCFGRIKKLVLYERNHPEVRLVLLLGEPYAWGDRKGWQPILRKSVERDRGVDPWATRNLEQRLWDEICKVERRGRPRGTSHPKRPALGDIPVSRKKDVDQLRQAGLDDKDLRILFDRIRNKTFAHIGRELGMSPQGVWKRYTGRVLPRIKSLNPTFSRPSFELLCLDLK